MRTALTRRWANALLTCALMMITVPGQTGPTKALSAGDLLDQFKNERVFWKQLEVAKKIVALGDVTVLPSLADWLNHNDRHLRGNVAFVFAGLGDERGFAVISAILNDRSERSEGQGRSTGYNNIKQQIRADRYYAAHLFGDLKDRRAVPILIPLLTDPDVRYIVPWALGEIGDKRADDALIETLSDSDPSIRVYVIYALEKLGAREALPRLRVLLDDHEMSRLGNPVTVADTAKAAIAKLEAMRQ